MRKKRDFQAGGIYHVTSRTNNKHWAFQYRWGKKIIMLTLEGVKKRFDFRLLNFCVMTNHIHLLIQPAGAEDLPKIMHWFKTHSSKRWNFIHKSSGHLWGNRYYARPVAGFLDYLRVMDYIDRNPVEAGLAGAVGEWKESGAWHRIRRVEGLVDSHSIGDLFRPPAVALLPAP
jgi:putative transposase